jgi:acetyl esterase/lipase
MINRLKRHRGLLLLTVLVVIALAAVAWFSLTYPPLPEALAALQSDAEVSVQAGPWWVFRPAEDDASVGLILYPGGLIDGRAYAPAARAIAAEGYVVAIVPMPLRLAVLGAERGTAVVEAFREVERWAIGGHSLGGAMAAQFARRHPDRVQGLVLWAAYPSGSDDLSASDLQVLSLYATNDGLTSFEEIEDSRLLLPPDTQFVAIEGGNHAQFGAYGPQRSDGVATISREAQQAQIVAATVGLLQELEASAPLAKRDHIRR